MRAEAKVGVVTATVYTYVCERARVEQTNVYLSEKVIVMVGESDEGLFVLSSDWC